MPIDQQDIYCTDLAITGDTNSNNVIDHGANTFHGIGPRALYIPIYVTEQFADTNDNSSTNIVFQSSQYVGFNSSITNTVIGIIPTNAAVGLLCCPNMPPLGQDQQFSRLTTGPAVGGNFSAGKITAFVTADPDLVRQKTVGWTGPSTS
jgi:hypothetical protein